MADYISHLHNYCMCTESFLNQSSDLFAVDIIHQTKSIIMFLLLSANVLR